MTGRNNGPSDADDRNDFILRILAGLALTLSTLSGGYTISTSDDRVRVAEVAKDFALRDAAIRRLETQLDRAEQNLGRIDRSGPATANVWAISRITDIEKRLAELETLERVARKSGYPRSND